MCGICGTIGFGDPILLRQMAEQLHHRGPDEYGPFVDDLAQVFIANRRLSIIDLAEGHQPVYSEDGAVAAVLNGELYNFLELRRELSKKGHSFRSRSDTEIIPHLYEEFGEDFPLHLDGMFAIALWDAHAGRFFLVRDHIGIKPLYIWENGGRLAFASEVKALLAIPQVEAKLDRNALHFLLNIRFNPLEQTLFEGIRKLSSGTILRFENGVCSHRRYWSPIYRADASIHRPEDCIDETRRLLGRAVRKQLVSDVPLGIYLSGGIDSSAIVALASEAAGGRLKTYSLGFNEPTDELEDAAAVARFFGTDHHEETIGFDALSVFPEVIYHVEEPKENAIQLYLLSRFTARHVKVVLSGLGGDELFGGYRIFDLIRPTGPWHRIIGRTGNACLLWPLRNLIIAVTQSFGPMSLDLFRRGMDYLLSTGVPARAYPILRNMWEHDRRLFRAIYTDEAQRGMAGKVEAFFTPLFSSGGDVREDFLIAEFSFKMVDDFLMNEDRTSMAHSLETRVPFLDRDLVEFAFTIPPHVKFAGGGLKVVLKKAMEGILPPATLQKPKWGFTFDSYYQFRKDLRRIAERELTREFIEEQGIFNYDFIARILRHPPRRSMRWHYFLLWLILGVKYWEDIFVRQIPMEQFRERKTG